MSNQNLYSALRAAFPKTLDDIAIETDQGLCYSWRDLDRASAMVANLFEDLGIPAHSRVAVQVEKSVEALILYLATLRAGHVFLPLNTAYRGDTLIDIARRFGALVGTVISGQGRTAPGLLYGGQTGVRFPVARGISLDLSLQFTQYDVNFRGESGQSQQWLFLTGFRY